MIKRIKRNSFTLLEIAVVMVIITIITTATFKGRSLLDNAKLIAIKADIDNISKKTNQFEGQYGGIPGDLANASSLWSGASNGNGNGIIDTPLEALYFWQHLQLAGLIVGNYDGASSYVMFDPNNASVAGGVYKSGFEGGMYSISNDANYGLSLTLSSTLGNNYTTAILTPTQAYNLDSKYDDGNPNTGIITAYTGNGLGATACINGGMYNFATKTPSCYLKFYLNKKTFTSATAITGCTGSPLGSTRISSQHVCPLGFYGYILESCTATPGATAPSWKEYRNSCEPVSCGDNKQYGDSFTMPCAPGYTGVGNVIYSCTKYGVFTPSDVSGCSNINIGACVANSSRILPCPIGYSGTWSQTCSNTTPGTVPAPNIRSNLCNKGYSGVINQQCNAGGYWETITNSCKPTNCGGSPIGATRPAHGLSCPYGSIGVPLEVCVYSDTTNYRSAKWQASYAACNVPSCPAIASGAPADTVANGYATWPSAAAGTSANGACDSANGYASPSTPTRGCNPDGSWGSVTNPCMKTCANGSAAAGPGTASWNIGPYYGDGTTVYNGTCTTGNPNPTPTRTCSTGGVWSAVSGSCLVMCPTINNPTTATGNATYGTTTPNTSANGTCQSCYQGTATLQCQSNGTWANSPTNSCTAIACNNSSNTYNVMFADESGSVTVPCGCNNVNIYMTYYDSYIEASHGIGSGAYITLINYPVVPLSSISYMLYNGYYSNGPGFEVSFNYAQSIGISNAKTYSGPADDYCNYASSSLTSSYITVAAYCQIAFSGCASVGVFQGCIPMQPGINGQLCTIGGTTNDGGYTTITFAP